MAPLARPAGRESALREERASRAGGPRFAAAPAFAFAGTLLLALGGGACAGPDEASEPRLPTPEERRMDPAFQAAFDALHAAVEGGDDEVARQILSGILARGPSEHLVAFARSYERILDGREAMRSVHLALESEAVEGSDLDHRLVLTARNDHGEDVVLRLPPATLHRLVVAIDPEGNERREAATSAIDLLEDLALPALGEVRLELESYELPIGVHLAVRERWTLELRSGRVVVGDVALPAQGPEVAPAHRTRLAPFLPTGPVAPEVLVEYVQRERVNAPPLLERTVRIDESRREEALDLLAPVVERLAREAPERVSEIVPALRWLARTGRPGGDPKAWAHWFELRRRAAELGPAVEGLDLPVAVERARP